MATHTQQLRRWILALVLILGALLTGIGYVIWLDKLSATRLQSGNDSPTQLRIQRPGQADMAMQRLADGSWLLQEPCTMPINSQRLQPLLAALQPSAHHYAAAEVDLDAAGLLQPLSTLLLDDSRILIGNTDLKGQRRYIQRDERIEFAPEWIQSLIDGGVSAFAELTLFNFDFDSVEATHTDGTPVKLSSADASLWQGVSAQQIVNWPIAGDEDYETTMTLRFASGATHRQARVHEFERFTAVKFDSSQCAYILPVDALPVVSVD